MILSIFIFFYIINISKQEKLIINLEPEKKISVKNFSIDDSLLFKIHKKNLKPNSSYTFQIHRIGPQGITFDIKFICNDIINLKGEYNNNIRMNDVSRLFFNTNEFNFPQSCGKNYNDDFFIISAQPKSKVYQFIDEKEFRLNIIVDFFYNIGGHSFRTFISTGFYKGLIIILIIIPLACIFFENKIKNYLIKSLGIEIKNN